MSLRKSPRLTPALLAANRRNAQKSRGPRTAGGKARARLNRLRHGRWSPLFARFSERPPGKPLRESMGHPAFAEARRHPASFVRPLPPAVGEALDERSRLPAHDEEEAEENKDAVDATGGASLMTERGTRIARSAFWLWQPLRARRHQLSAILPQNRRKTHKRGYPPTPEYDRSRNVADKKGDTKRAVVQDGGKQRCRVLSIT